MSKVLLGLPEKVFDGEGGAYYSWSSSKMPVLGDARVGACRILLHHQGYALPHFGDSTKIAFVLQGSGEGMAGLISPDSKNETVVRLKKGACITITKGVISWWYNPDDSLLDIVFIGETSDAIVPGEFTYQFLSGTNGLLNSFSSQFLSSLYNIPTQEATRLGSSQAGMVAVKLKDGAGPGSTLPKQDCFNFCHVTPHLEVTCGVGLIKRFTSGEDDVVKVGPADGAELSAFEIKLEPKSGVPPLYMARSAAQVFFVVKGGAWVQIVSGNGGVQLDEHVDAGYLFVVPRFYTVAMVAGDDGLECLSVMNTSKPVLGQWANIWHALSPGALEAALNLKIEDIEVADKIKNALIIAKPKQ